MGPKPPTKIEPRGTQKGSIFGSRSWRVQASPKRGPRAPKGGPRGPKRATRQPQGSPRGAQEGPRGGQRSPREPQENSQRVPDSLREAQDSPKEPKQAPRESQERPKRVQESPREQIFVFGCSFESDSRWVGVAENEVRYERSEGLRYQEEVFLPLRTFPRNP